MKFQKINNFALLTALCTGMMGCAPEMAEVKDDAANPAVDDSNTNVAASADSNDLENVAANNGGSCESHLGECLRSDEAARGDAKYKASCFVGFDQCRESRAEDRGAPENAGVAEYSCDCDRAAYCLGLYDYCIMLGGLHEDCFDLLRDCLRGD